MPKVLLYILSGQYRVLPTGLLKTCREYHSDLLEMVHMVSLYVAYESLRLMEFKPGELTFATLRPGTTAPRLPLPLAADGRLRAMKKPLMLARGPPQEEADVRLMLEPLGSAATDWWGKLDSLLLVGQTKGQVTGPAAGASGGDETMTPSDSNKYFALMENKYPQSNIQELLTTRRVINEAKTLEIADPPVLSGVFAKRVFIYRANIVECLGFYLSGIAGRCTNDDKYPPTVLSAEQQYDLAAEEDNKQIF